MNYDAPDHPHDRTQFQRFDQLGKHDQPERVFHVPEEDALPILPPNIQLLWHGI